MCVGPGYVFTGIAAPGMLQGVSELNMFYCFHSVTRKHAEGGAAGGVL